MAGLRLRGSADRVDALAVEGHARDVPAEPPRCKPTCAPSAWRRGPPRSILRPDGGRDGRTRGQREEDAPAPAARGPQGAAPGWRGRARARQEIGKGSGAEKGLIPVGAASLKKKKK